ncbi:hypothetical protein ASG53_15435 [Sanguibacter sp. Leaf3]|nr:hypothetical protein ASG53_15435 [Sanguibacter sp. Leaf3]
MARTRPIQEGILDQLDFNKFFGNYVTGQIRAEFLDTDDADDIATSDRQRLVEDDERVQLLLKKLRQMFNDAGSQWSKERPKEKFRQATEKYPTIRDWVDKRPDGQRDAARNMIGTIASLHLDREVDRPALFKAGVLAFERIAIEDTGKELEKLSQGLTASDVLPLLATSRSYEDALYLQILRSRLEAIERLEHLINKDELEKVLQKHLFDNLWLLDPSWEGAAGDSDMEIALSRIRSGALFSKTEAENQKQGRIDIQYRSAAGVHMIVELKRYGRSSKIDDLVEQGNKYHEALREVLEKRQQAHSGINVVFVLGQKPKVGYLGDRTESQFITEKVQHIDGRVLYYDELLHNAQQRYREYREKKRESTALDQVLQSLDELIPEPSGGKSAGSTEDQKGSSSVSTPTPSIMAKKR